MADVSGLLEELGALQESGMQDPQSMARMQALQQIIRSKQGPTQFEEEIRDPNRSNIENVVPPAVQQRMEQENRQKTLEEMSQMERAQGIMRGFNPDMDQAKKGNYLRVPKS